eukprot:31198-Pelagococcus_subviridis.AAC.47
MKSARGVDSRIAPSRARDAPPRSSVTWEEAPTKGTPPEARSGHTFAVAGTKAYVFGGTGRKNGTFALASP